MKILATFRKEMCAVVWWEAPVSKLLNRPKNGNAATSFAEIGRLGPGQRYRAGL